MDLDQKNLEEHLKMFESACRTVGLRLTHQRLEVYRELVMSADHPSAETLHQRLRRTIPTLSLDTVYRTLATLASHGLINKVDTVESQARFEATLKQHHHLICNKCKQIVDFAWPSIQNLALPEEVGSWGNIASTNVVIYGICKQCL